MNLLVFLGLKNGDNIQQDQTCSREMDVKAPESQNQARHVFCCQINVHYFHLSWVIRTGRCESDMLLCEILLFGYWACMPYDDSCAKPPLMPQHLDPVMNFPILERRYCNTLEKQETQHNQHQPQGSVYTSKCRFSSPFLKMTKTSLKGLFSAVLWD